MKKMAKPIKDVRVYRGAESSTDHYLLSIRLSFPTPRGVNKQNLKGKGNTLQEKFKVRLLNDESTKWLHKKEWMIGYSTMKKTEMLKKNGMI
jgi:hypothetical protein